ncbi:ThiF family adenylyltransferase [Alicyclobacillus sp. SO9]|uniref:HesA/MoeB/ThiF family protein n=1 Tax=Alicyclobacillus sp. SO9 TaxID=2665646 RepID=UPI0018E89D7F|nr:ThiF family adenylyltransferase [Alicyclobacillus sp. SO9]QQE78006.1 ThiF family adenylyltransferase [Alicyclobacillus sp. SO9]
MGDYVVNPYIEVRKNDNVIIVRMYSSRKELKLTYDPALETLLSIGRQEDSTNWFSTISDKHHVSQKDYESALHSLLEVGIVVPRSATSNENQMLNRQDVFFTGAGFNGPEIRERLEHAKVLVLGTGGIGASLTQQLAMVGVRNFVLVDPDTVDLTNLNRTSMFRKKDVGKPKIEVIRTWIEERVDSSHVSTYRESISGSDDIVRILKQERPIDLIVDCMDQPSTEQTGIWVSTACWEHKIPHFIAGGYNYHGGSVGQTCIPDETACSNCHTLWLKEKNKFQDSGSELISRAKSGGSYYPLVSLVTSMQCAEIVKVLTGYSQPLFTDTQVEIDIESLELKLTEIKRHKNCTVCH